MNLKTKDNSIIPFIGIGTFPLRGKAMSDNVIQAIQFGYRLFDSSDDYQNEDGIGDGINKAIKLGLVSREQVFLQTKVSDCDSYASDYRQNAYFTRYSSLMKSVPVRNIIRSKVFNSLRELSTDYLDSVLLHFAYPSYYEEMWAALIELQKEGYIRYIGVSNFDIRELEVLSKTSVIPQINEIYISPFGTKRDLVGYCINNNIQLMSYSPLCVVRSPQFMNDLIQNLMDKYHKSRAQIILRWNVEVGSYPLPKSSNESRLKENFNIFDFGFTVEELSLLNNLNFNHQYMPISKECPGI